MENENAYLLIEAFDKRWRDFLIKKKLYQNEASEETVHDLRVASRRFLSILELIRGVDPRPRLQRLRQDYKVLLNSFDELHDAQVMIVEVSELLEKFPKIEPLLDSLEKREKRLLRETEKKADLVNINSLKGRISAIREDVQHLLQTDPGVNEEVLCVVDDAYSLALNRFENLDRSHVATIHHLRISFKKFRYFIEIVSPLVDGFPRENFEFMHELQAVMGNIQDIDILLNYLDENAKKTARFNLDEFTQFLQSEMQSEIDTFFSIVHSIHTFWRKSAGAPFPWNMPEAKSETQSEASEQEIAAPAVVEIQAEEVASE